MNFPDLSTPKKLELLISFFDVSGFAMWAKGRTDEELFKYVGKLAGLTSKRVLEAGGHVVKYIGDAALIIFPAEKAEKGIFCLLDLQQEMESVLENENMPGKAAFSCHVGTAAVGLLDPVNQPDIIGEAVNTASILARKRGRGAFVLSPQAFRRLSPQGRKRFRKFSEPYVYLAKEQV